MGVGRISVFESPEIQGVLLAMRGIDKELAAQIRKATKTVTVGEWRGFLAAEASTALERRTLVDSARVAVGNQNVSLRTGQLAKKTSGGGKLYQLTGGVEFGAHPGRPVRSKSGKGKAYWRKQGTGFKAPNPGGYVAYPAVAKAIPRIASLWVSTVVRTLHEAFEGGR